MARLPSRSSAITTSALIWTQRRLARRSGVHRGGPRRGSDTRDLADPHWNSRCGSVSRVSVSQITAEGCQNAPTRFLPSGRFTRSFRRCGIDLAEKGGRHRHEPDASVVHRGDEPADIGHDTAPDGDDRVGPSEPALRAGAHVLHDRERLGRFAIRELDPDRGPGRPATGCRPA